MFAVGGERFPVALFKRFVSRRLQKLKTTGPFNTSIKTNRKPNDNVWFKVQPMGENKINDMTKGGKQRKAILAVLKLIFQSFFVGKIYLTAHRFKICKNKKK